MSAKHAMGASPEHFELMRGALDHIAKTARQSRSQTRRLRWIELRAERAVRGEPYEEQAVQLPKSAGPGTPEKLQRRIAQLAAEKAALLESLQWAMARIAKHAPHQAVEGDAELYRHAEARALIAKATGSAS